MERSHSRREFLSLAAMPLLSQVAPAQTGSKPNFIFFLVDDLGWADVGAFGSRYHRTPNIDALASRGMKFTQGYAACPVCSPTRASIQTGKYPARLGVTNWLPGLHQLPYSKLIAPKSRQELPLKEVTLAEALKPAGYRTAHIGKWHLGGKGFLPQDQGYDANVGGSSAGSPKSYFYPEWGDRPPITAQPGEYLTDRLTRDAVAFVRENKDRPFFLNFDFYNVHIPLEAKKEMAAQYPNAPHPVYAAMVQSVDDAISKVMAEVEKHGLTNRTVVVFMSDNGGLTVPEWRCQTPTNNAPLREGNGHLYEGGIREPWIVCWPGVAKAGSVCETPVVSTDFFPTLAAIAGVPKAGDPADGISLVPLLRGGKALSREAIYWHYPHYSNQGGKPGGAIRQGDYKLIEFYEDHRVELYRVPQDIGEKNDLAAKMPAKAAELRAKLADWRKRMNAVMPQPNPKYDPKREWEGFSWKQRCV